MAITVKTIPNSGNYMSAHGDLFFVVDSSNKANTNFKYVFDVYVDAVLVSRVKIFPEPTYSYGVFNAGPIIRTYLNSAYFGGEAAWLSPKTADGYFKKGYVIKYGEEYGSPVTTYTNLTTSPTYQAYNYYNQLLPINRPAALDLYADDILSSLEQTSFEVSLYDNFFVNYWNTAATSITYGYTTYNQAGVVLSSGTIIDATLFMQLNLGPLGINGSMGNIITSNVYRYVVTIGAHTLTFYPEECVGKYVSQSLVFFNELGGYQSAFFRMKNRRKVDVERKTHGRNNYALGSSFGEVTYGTINAQHGNARTYSVKQTNKFTLCTDFLTDAEFEWLANLFQSSQVFMEFKRVTKHGTGIDTGTILTEGGVVITTESGDDLLSDDSIPDPIYYTLDSLSFIPVKVVPTSYTYKTVGNDKLNPLELEVEILQTYNSQFQ